MKNIFKYLFVLIAAAFVVTSCDNDADRDWTTQEPSFRLYDTTLGANVLYASMEENPFILTWDNTTGGSGSYSVVVSAAEDFASKVELGTSDTNSLKTTIGALNMAMLQAGLNPYSPQTVYVRVEAGSAVSNAISFTVTPYPVDIPVITNPTSATALVLDKTNPDAVAATVQWSDYASYGVDVNYTIEVAKKGETAFQNAGSTTNEKSFDWTNKFLNTVILKTGAQPNVESEIDVRVTASTSSAGGTITKTSDVVTFKVTPYVSFVNLYLIGDATAAGWDNNAGNMNMYPLLGNHLDSNSYTFTGYFGNGGFKIIKNKGSWDDQYGLGSSAGVLSTDGGSGNIPVPAAGYYKLSINTSALTYTLEAVAAPSVSYATVGIIGSATPNSWDSSTPMVQSTFDSHIWMLGNTALTDGEMKFRANDSWDVNWGSSDENFGTGTPGGPNIPVSGGTYNIYFNDYTGDYVLVKQ